MKENSNEFNINSGCIRQDVLLKYLKGELLGRERNLVEKHLVECEMCRDELEGLSNLPEPERIIEIETELNAFVDERTAPRIVWFNRKVALRAAAAAILTIGVSSVLYFFTLNNTPSAVVTENQKLKNAAEAPGRQPQKLDVTAIPKDANEFGPIKKEEKRRIEKPAAPVIVTDKVRIADGLSVSADSVSETLAFSEAEVADEVLASKNIGTKDSEAIAGYNVAMAVQKLEEARIAAVNIQKEENAGVVAERSESAKKSMVTTTDFIQQRITVKSALEDYNQKNYQKALQEFSALYAPNTINDTLIYYRAMCFYRLESYKEALDGLETINKNSASKFYHDAQWYYALSLIELGRKEEANNLLDIIAKSDSPYKDLVNQRLKQ